MIFTSIPAFGPMTPTDELDNEFEFHIIPTGDVITSASVTAVPAGLTITDVTFTTNPNAVVFWTTGGTVDTVYTITATVLTAGLRRYNRSATLAINAPI